jgi:uncharacterized repeat protein (TIGR02543 family)
VRTGYTFSNWYTAESSGDVISWSFPLTENKTVHAHWTAISYTVTYNGSTPSSGSMATTSHTYTENTALRNNAFAKTGYAFAGWATSSGGTTVVYANGALLPTSTLFPDNTTTGKTLYAVWTSLYTITYSKNGGTGGTLPANQSGLANTVIITGNFTSPVLSGKTFVGWNTKTDGSGAKYAVGAAYTITGNATLYAEWVTTVNAGEPTLSPFVDCFLGIGEPLTISAASPDGGTLSYQWYSNTSKSNTSGSSVVTSASLPNASINTNLYYWVKVTNTNNSVSGTKTMSVNSPAVSVQILNLRERIAMAKDRTATITIFADEILAPITTTDMTGASTKITLESYGGATRTLSLSTTTTGYMFLITSGASFTIKDGLTLKGRASNTGSVVALLSTAKFTMDGGAITGNSPATGGGFQGGGVVLSDAGTLFTMNGGVIYGNSAGSGYGGGVSQGASSKFIMNGGEIRNNSAVNGGGVYTYSADFIKTASATGGIIRGNTTPASANTVSASGAAVFNWPVAGGNTRQWIEVTVPATTAINVSGPNYYTWP